MPVCCIYTALAMDLVCSIAQSHWYSSIRYPMIRNFKHITEDSRKSMRKRKQFTDFITYFMFHFTLSSHIRILPLPHSEWVWQWSWAVVLRRRPLWLLWGAVSLAACTEVTCPLLTLVSTGPPHRGPPDYNRTLVQEEGLAEKEDQWSACLLWV